DEEVVELAKIMGVAVEVLRDKVNVLQEFNPMLGHRGCRLGISFPEITEMQAQAIVERVADATQKAYGVKVRYAIGTMIELPRACMVADEIAEEAEFFSFGTN